MRLRAAKLPTPIAWSSARVAPLEGEADAKSVRAYLKAWLSWSTVVVLSAHGPNPIPPPLASVMRQTMNGRLGTGDWGLLLTTAMGSSTHAKEVLGVDMDTHFPGDHPVTRAVHALGGGGDRVVDFVEAARGLSSETAGTVRDAVDALVAEAPWVAGRQLLFVQQVDGARVLIRRLMGTSFPELEEIEVGPTVKLFPGSMHLWDRGGNAVRVPPWLARYDNDGLRLFAGRDPGGWCYSPPVLGQEEDDLIVFAPPGVPAFLKEEDPPEAHGNDTVTGLNVRDIERLRQAMQSRGPKTPETRGKEVILRVIAGRELMRFTEVAADQEVVLGRSPKYANMALHHAKVSRRHAKVWREGPGTVRVADLGSTNGTAINGKLLPSGQVGSLLPGDVLSVGAVPLRVERVDAAHLERLRHLNATPDLPGRDPLTGLLPSKWLDGELRQLIGHADSHPISGVLMRVLGLDLIRRNEGQEAADVLYLNAARIVSYELIDPRPVIRTEYGELLVVCMRYDREDAFELATKLCRAFTQQVWDAPGAAEPPDVVAAVAEMREDEPMSGWMARMRGALPDAGTTGHVFRG